MIQLLHPGYLLEINHRVEQRPVLLLVVQIQECFVLYVRKQGKATFLLRAAKIIKGVNCFIK